MITLTDILIVFAMLIAVVYFYLTRNFNYWKHKNVPHKKPLVLFGNLLDVLLGNASIGQHLAKLYNQFDGPYFGLYTFDQPFLVLKDPEIIKRILIKDFHVFTNRFFVYDEKIDPFSSTSLFGMKTPHWKPLRSKLTPIFTSSKLKMMFHLMVECGENLQTYLKSNSDKDMDVKVLAGKYTSDVIAICAFGITANSFVTENGEFRTAASKLFDRSFLGSLKIMSYFFTPLLVKIFKHRFISKEPAEFLRGPFLATIEQREIDKNIRNDLIDILIELKNQEAQDDEFKFYGDRLLAQALTFVSAGHDTTTLTISFTLHALCLHTEIQDRLRKEILEVIQKHGGLTYTALNDMQYLHMVVSETLRKYNVTAFLVRESSEDYKIPETGLVIEKGLPILIAQFGLHFDAKYFPNPEKYDPERFNAENKQNITPFAYLPFGDGPRNCIGERFGLMNAKLGLIHIIKSFKVVNTDQTKESMIFTPYGPSQPRSGIKMKFQKL